MSFVKGSRTYIICTIGVGLGVYQALIPYLHLHPIPGWVLTLLGFLGLSAARAGITGDTQKAVSDILSQITAPAASSASNAPPALQTRNMAPNATKPAPDNLTFTRTLR